jgi:hypothetical protein
VAGSPRLSDGGRGALLMLTVSDDVEGRAVYGHLLINVRYSGNLAGAPGRIWQAAKRCRNQLPERWSHSSPRLGAERDFAAQVIYSACAQR